MNPICTEILRVEPRDPYGSHRESLASLIIRTARENDASPAQLLERKFSYHDERGGLACSIRALGLSIGQSINGSGEFSERFVRRAESLTRFKNLRASTTLSFRSFTTINGLLRQRQAWSPDYLRDSEVKSYPLLWCLDPVRVCLKTKKPLASICPRCRRSLLMLAGGGDVGVCNHCGAALGDGKVDPTAADPVANAIRSMDYELWIAEQLGEYIRFQVRWSLPNNFSYAETIRFWFERFSISISARDARKLGTSQTAMSNWLATGSIPRLRMTLNLCWVFGVSLLEFLFRKTPKGHDGKLRESIDGNMRHASVSCRRKIDRPALEAELVAILREDRYAMMPFAEICKKKLQRRDLVVRQTFPELSRAIAKRYLENRKLIARVRQEQFCATIKTLAQFLHARNIVPNYKTLTPYLDGASKLRCAWAITALQEIRMELGYEDESEQLLLAM